MTGKNGKTISLVLGSGGARGLAHIGVIHVLEERGYEITSIAGCSVGALVGGIYAAETFGFSMEEVLIFGIALNVAAGVGAFAMGYLDDRIGGKRG